MVDLDDRTKDRLAAVSFQVTKWFIRTNKNWLRGWRLDPDEMVGAVYVKIYELALSRAVSGKATDDPEAYYRICALYGCRGYLQEIQGGPRVANQIRNGRSFVPLDYLDEEDTESSVVLRDTTRLVDLRDEIGFYFSAVNDMQREVLVLAFVYALSNPEIAGILNKGEAWARHKVVTGLIQIRRLLVQSQLWDLIYRDVYYEDGEEWESRRKLCEDRGTVRKSHLEFELAEDGHDVRTSRLLECYDRAHRHVRQRGYGIGGAKGMRTREHRRRRSHSAKGERDLRREEKLEAKRERRQVKKSRP